MGLFFLSFFLIYGGFHLYFFLRVRAAFALGGAAQTLLAVFLLLGVMTPVIIRSLENYGVDALARLTAWAGYLWMAFILLFFSTSLLLELYRALVYLGGLIFRGDVDNFLPSARTLFLLPMLVALGIVVFGAHEAQSVRSESLVIRSAKVPKEAGRIRVVQISDVHVGLLVRGDYLAEILRKVKEASPDLLVATGDLVDGQGDNLSEAAVRLHEIRPPLGKFAVTGNHEFYEGIDKAMAFTADAGFTVLRGENATVAGIIDLAGVDDPEVRRFGSNRLPPDREILEKTSGKRFTILLKHRPLVEESALGTFDLQLSGHTHKGQIFPFSLVTRAFFRYHAGNYTLPKGALIHVSRGTGTWGPPVRFLAPPEITVIDLMPE